MAAFLDVCRFNPSAGGTGDWTYTSAVTGYQSPAAAGVVNGRLYKYRAESADLSQWEVGEGAYNTSTGVLARTTVLFNSSGTTAKINFTTIPLVAVVALKEDLISIEESNSFTTAQQAQARSNIGVTAIGAANVGQIPGTTGTTQPAAGNIGEVITIGAGISLPGSGVSANVGTASVSPGIYDVTIVGTFSGPGATTSSDWILAFGISSASVSASQAIQLHERIGSASPMGDMSIVMTSPSVRIAVASSTTYYLCAQATYSGASGYSVQAQAYIRRAS
ncbi:hypothetical protein [Bradyrhizobium japonicum]|uniref:hypothetical protein n=1 Tax=Bradyrhizobium japonicum TaxID=375 RepID=UPI002012118A|nr:hypothetical protein [Bradyrhizobium japonicum]